MSEWQETTLEIIAEPVKEGWKPDKNDIKPYIGLEHIEQEKLRLISVGSSEQVISNKFAFESGDILFGKLRPYFRKVVRTNFSGVCSTDIWVMRAEEGFDQTWLFYFLADWNFINLANGGEGGSRMPRADWDFLKTTAWSTPPLPEQRAIAEVLSSLDDKIDLLHRQNQTLEALAETLFRQWFIEEADPEWEERPLDKVADYLNGLACQKYPPQKEEGKLPVLKIRELKGGIGQDSDWVRSNVPEQYLVHAGDVIFSWSASLLVKLWGGQTCVLNQHLFKVTSTEFPKWYYYLWTKHHLDEFIAIAETMATTMGHIKRSDLASCLCVIPDSESLAKMNSVFKPLLEKLQESDKQIRHLEKTRDELLPKLMSGEVRVNQINLKGETQ
jgi:type I restriction enzyme S subunit